MQVSLLSVDQNTPWFVFPTRGDSEAWSSATNRGSKGAGSVALDVSSTTFAMHSTHPTPVPLTARASAVIDQLVLADSKESPSDDLGLLPLATSTLVHIPSQMDYTFISMLHLHFFFLVQSSRSTATSTIQQVQQAVTRNFHELQVLGLARHGPHGTHNLPLHLAALEAMLTTLDEPDGNGLIE